jgi:hypothetical protein
MITHEQAEILVDVIEAGVDSFLSWPTVRRRLGRMNCTPEQVVEAVAELCRLADRPAVILAEDFEGHEGGA